MKEFHKLNINKRVYDIETESYHLHNGLFKMKLYVQDIIKFFSNPMFMNKRSKDFTEVDLQSKSNQISTISLNL